MGRIRIAVLVSAVVACFAGGAIVGAELIKFGKYELRVGGNFSPKRLPAKKLAPIAMNIKIGFSTTDGSTPEPLREIILDFDRDGKMYTRGLRRCRPGQIVNTNTQDALRNCRRSLVGRGTARAIVDFDDQDPFPASGPLLAFHGGKGLILLHVYANVPAPTAFVVPARVSRAPGRAYRHRVTTEVPVIAGGHGSLLDFKLKLKRTWKHKGKRRSFLYARCNKGYFLVRGDLRWQGGNRVQGSIVRTCRRR